MNLDTAARPGGAETMTTPEHSRSRAADAQASPSSSPTPPGAGQAGLSAMLWFRADPANDAPVRAALERVARTLAAEAPARIGRRHEEDKPYRTWMIDAGPIAAEHFDAVLYRMHKLIGSTGLNALMKGEAHLESFAWETLPE